MSPTGIKKPKMDVQSKDSVASSINAPAYQPLHFIRAHCQNFDRTDIQTQVWDVVFEPNLDDKTKTTSLVATCGGNSICILDVSTAEMPMKYVHHEPKEKFYTLAWSTLEFEEKLSLNGSQNEQSMQLTKSNILVSGGIRGEIRIIHPIKKVCFFYWRPSNKKSIAVNSLKFHSEQPSWLFCATSDGEVSLWDLGQMSLPSYSGIDPRKLLKLFPDYGEIYNIVWSGKNGWLFAGTAAGLVGWNIDDDKIKDTENGTYCPIMLDFIMPEHETDKGEHPVVDSLEVVADWMMAAKCALHGLIYIIDMKKTIHGKQKLIHKGNSEIIEKKIHLSASLKWSDTDGFYMNMGCNKASGLIGCGDDEGSIWLYHKLNLASESPVKLPTGKTIPHTMKLEWPTVYENEADNKRKTASMVPSKVIVNKVVISHDNEYIVAVTSNNMVCVWKSMTSTS